jgi:hypothetical protein
MWGSRTETRQGPDCRLRQVTYLCCNGNKVGYRDKLQPSFASMPASPVNYILAHAHYSANHGPGRGYGVVLLATATISYWRSIVDVNTAAGVPLHVCSILQSDTRGPSYQAMQAYQPTSACDGVTSSTQVTDGCHVRDHGVEPLG